MSLNALALVALVPFFTLIALHLVAVGLSLIGGLALVRGEAARVQQVGSALKWLPVLFARAAGRRLEAIGALHLGDTETATRIHQAALEGASKAVCDWTSVNWAVEAYVTAGRYGDALHAADAWSDAARAAGRSANPSSYAFVRINQAEALYNLGRDPEALEVLASVAELAEHPLALNGVRCMRAWISTHVGDLDAARRDLDELERGAFGRLYAAEIEFTWAALERESGNLDLALRYAAQGRALAVRRSSARNGLFLEAGIVALAGESERARALFREAVGDPYRSQGGDGLTRYARFLDEMGESNAAHDIRRLTIERDPESIFARRAEQALAAEAAGMHRTNAPPKGTAGKHE